MNDSMTVSTVTNSTLECSTMNTHSESEAKSERILNYMDYPMMLQPGSRDSQGDDNSFSFMGSSPECSSLLDMKGESALKKAALQKCESSKCITNVQSEEMYKTMCESMYLLQSTKSEILKIFEEKQNRLKNQAQNESSSDAIVKVSDIVEKKRKRLLTETIHKIRSHVDALEQVSRMF